MPVLLIFMTIIISPVTNAGENSLYEEIKENFLLSSMCDPVQVINDPSERANGLLLSKASKSLSFLGSTERFSTNKFKTEEFLRFAEAYELDESTVDKVKMLIQNMMPYSSSSDDLRRSLVAKAKGLVLQKIASLSLTDATYKKDVIIDALVSSNVFIEDDEGNAKCPFLELDAFQKAFDGHQKVIKSLSKTVKKVSQLTVIDLTRPSNERRLFVIDLSQKKVILNTWVAHGMGDVGGAGEDGLGSNPEISNINGSKKSSDGFILATQASYGNLFGPNVLLKGLDIDNKNIASRGILVHGWSSPFGQYTSGLQVYKTESENSSVIVDPFIQFIKMDFENNTYREMERSLYMLYDSLPFSKYIAPTEGCPGVPVAKLGHLDYKGRINKNVLEILREDLPESIIFTYSGPLMRSKFFD
jgi:hypothetical protein